MIVDGLLDFLQGLAEALVGLLPSFTVPSWLNPATLAGPLGSLASMTSSLSVWVPWTVIFGMFATVWAVRVGAATFQVVMKVYAMIRGGS